MRAVLVFLAALAASLSISVSVPPLAAEDGSPPADPASMDAKSFLDSAARAEGATVTADRDELASPACPGTPYRLAAFYPQGLDGGGPLDQAVKAAADGLMADARQGSEDLARDPGDCGAFAHAGYSVGSRAFVLPGKVTSVLFNYDQSSGGAHPSYGYKSVNLVPAGPGGEAAAELLASGLFPDPARSLPLLWARIFRDTCAMGNDTAPGFYGAPACSGPAPPLPDQLTPSSTLDGMGHAVLTSLGLTVSLDPYECWSWATGPVRLDISKDDLVGMGASPDFWQ
jgi:hypothetical protein